MQIKKGQNRIVFIFPRIGIVVKIPIIHFIAVSRLFMRRIKERDWKFLKQELIWSIDGLPGYKRLLLKGIFDNWREFWFYLRTRHPFLQPTYFSFLGLIDIQPLGDLLNISIDDFRNQLYEITKGAIDDDGHHFNVLRNFCFVENKLKILDYGDPRTQKVVLECGMKIFNEFVPNYSKEKTS